MPLDSLDAEFLGRDAGSSQQAKQVERAQAQSCRDSRLEAEDFRQSGAMWGTFGQDWHGGRNVW